MSGETVDDCYLLRDIKRFAVEKEHKKQDQQPKRPSEEARVLDQSYNILKFGQSSFPVSSDGQTKSQKKETNKER